MHGFVRYCRMKFCHPCHSDLFTIQAGGIARGRADAVLQGRVHDAKRLDILLADHGQQGGRVQDDLPYQGKTRGHALAFVRGHADDILGCPGRETPKDKQGHEGCLAVPARETESDGRISPVPRVIRCKGVAYGVTLERFRHKHGMSATGRRHAGLNVFQPGKEGVRAVCRPALDLFFRE